MFWIDDFENWALADSPILPLEERPEYELFSYGENDAHPSDPFDSAEAYIAGKNLEALYFALTGEELTATVTQLPGIGHRHNGEKTFLYWRPALRLSPHNGLAAVSFTRWGGVTVDFTSWRTVGWGIFHIPSALETPVLWPRMRLSVGDGSQVDGDALDLEISMYNAVSGASNVINHATAILTQHTLRYRKNDTIQTDLHENVWVAGDPIELAGATINDVNGKNLVYTKFRARAPEGEANLKEISIGWRKASK